MRLLLTCLLALPIAACGVVYQSPDVTSLGGDASKVRVIPVTGESVLMANRAAYRPQTLPAIFSQTSGGVGAARGAGALPDPAVDPQTRPAALETRLPPAVPFAPYTIGVGDVVLLATPQTGSTVEELSGLLAAQNRRQGYTVQDDGMIAIPDVGRVALSGLSLEEAEAELFQRLVENQIDPTFSLEVAEFNSKRVTIGGAVGNSTVTPIALTPLYLDAALAAAGGVQVADRDYASIRIYREGTLYQIPLADFYTNGSLRKTQLQDGDSVFVDTAFELDRAQAYFSEQIQLAEFKQRSRAAALQELQLEVSIRQANLNEARNNYQTQLELGAVKRDYAYITGEVGDQGRYALPFGQTASLADALYDQAGGVPTRTGNVAEIYVLRGSTDPREFSAVTAWHLDARNASALVLATRLQLRPNDVIFVSEQPITKWNRVVSQIVPALITSGANALAN